MQQVSINTKFLFQVRICSKKNELDTSGYVQAMSDCLTCLLTSTQYQWQTTLGGIKLYTYEVFLKPGGAAVLTTKKHCYHAIYSYKSV